MPNEAIRSSGRWQQLQAWRERNAVAEGAAFFFAGFLLDVLTLSRIDDRVSLIQQGVYLLLVAWLLLIELRVSMGKGDPPALLRKVWHHSENALHFLFGSLLSVYALLFLKSASNLVSFVFLLFLFGLLIANEFPQVRRLGAMLRFALFGFSVTAYCTYLIPVLAGNIRAWLFYVSVAIGCLPLWFFYRRVRAWGVEHKEVLRRVVFPGAAINVMLVVLYLLKAIPPVPLSVQFIGIYHAVEKTPAGYDLMRLRPDWMFWQNGDQTFEARPEDRIYCFVRIFAPTGFEDRVKLRWLYKDAKRGWVGADAIPLEISGGRGDGFRGFAYKAKYQPGQWRVEVETEDGREVGSIRFSVTPDESTTPRTYNVDHG